MGHIWRVLVDGTDLKSMKHLNAYLLSLGFVVLAILLRWLLDPILGSQLVLTTLFGAVALAGWFGGIGPGILAMIVGYATSDYLFIAPRGQVGIATLPQFIGLLLYLASCALTIAFGESMRKGRRLAEAFAAELMRQREQLQVTLASIGDAVIATDRDGRITFMNAIAERLTGWVEKDAGGQRLETVFRIIHERTREPVENPAIKALRLGHPVALANHTVLVAKDGAQVAIDDSAAPIQDRNSGVFGAILVFRDVSERRRQEIVKHQLAAIVESSHDAIIGHALDGTITSWNRAAELLYGYSAGEMIGTKKAVLLPPDRTDELVNALEKLKRGAAVPSYETFRRRKDGGLIEVLITASPILDEYGEVVGAATIGRDITVRKSAEAALREANRRKDEFLAILAHELRNPLAPLSNNLYIASRSSTDEEMRKHAFIMMERQLRQLVRLVDDLLDVSRISQGKLQLRLEIVDLRSVIQNAMETTRQLMERSEHRLEVRMPESPVYVRGDFVRLSQVFSNLLNNAAKYTADGGRIDLAMSVSGLIVCIELTDSGVGIPQHALSAIFDIFTQVDDALTRQSGGLGIGLWLVRTLVELHGGSVEARSAGMLQGSTFAVRLPISDLPPAESADRIDATVPPVVKRRVLVVDDNADSADSLALVLRLKGHDVYVANDGERAVEQAIELRPDVILLDIGLPKLDGYRVASRIRADLGSKVVLIAITGWGRPEDRDRAREAGFNHHLTKPIDPDNLDHLFAGEPMRGAVSRHNGE